MLEDKNKIHPLIQEMDISAKSKAYFNKLALYEIIEDEINLSNKFNKLDEANQNLWSFGVNLEFCNKDDVKAFYQAVINSRRTFIELNKITQKIVFYTWYDAQAGQLRFSLIQDGWTGLPKGKELPFGCIVKKAISLDCIIDEFINDNNKGLIPFEELRDIDPEEVLGEQDEENKFELNVYSIIL